MEDRSERKSDLGLAVLEVTQGHRLLVSTWHDTGRWRADWMMEGSGGETTATRMLGSCRRMSSALLTFSSNWRLESESEAEQEWTQRSMVPTETTTSWKVQLCSCLVG